MSEHWIVFKCIIFLWMFINGCLNMEIYACYTAIVKVIHVPLLVDRDACGRGWTYTGEQEQWTWAQEIRERKAWPGSGWVSVSFVFSVIDTRFHCVFGTIHLTWKPKFRFFYLKSCWPWRKPTDRVRPLDTELCGQLQRGLPRLPCLVVLALCKSPTGGARGGIFCHSHEMGTSE